jgi:hypothetical protein
LENALHEVAHQSPRHFIECTDRLVNERTLAVDLFQETLFKQDLDQRGDRGVGQLAALMLQKVARLAGRLAAVLPKHVHHLELTLGQFFCGWAGHFYVLSPSVFTTGYVDRHLRPTPV